MRCSGNTTRFSNVMFIVIIIRSNIVTIVMFSGLVHVTDKDFTPFSSTAAVMRRSSTGLTMTCSVCGRR